jgi:hypothetical protein
VLDPLDQFLRACARAAFDEEDKTRLVRAASRVTHWSELPSWAEYHGLAPMVWRRAGDSGIAISTAEWKQITLLALRCRIQGRAQEEALGEVIEALDAAGIESVVLKGAVLAHILYPSPDLRPMNDLDILVAPNAAARAQEILRQLGFDAPRIDSRATQRFHHHLPTATRQHDGVVVNVEIHRDAVSRDQPGRLRLDARLQPRREVMVAGRRIRTLGHEDMLANLCAHVLEPSEYVRLISVSDFVGYAGRYAPEIDWDFMRRRRWRVVNALTLMHHVTPLPAPLEPFRPAGPAPAGVGRGLVPLALAVARQRGAWNTVRDLLYPSKWWMRAYYAVPPYRSLGAVRWSRHLGRLFYWAGRRVLSASGGRA